MNSESNGQSQNKGQCPKMQEELAKNDSELEGGKWQAELLRKSGSGERPSLLKEDEHSAEARVSQFFSFLTA
jgi:hypothetical protein